MKKILLLFTSFLFTSNLILFGADSFGAQADKAAKLPFLEHLHIDRLPLDEPSKKQLTGLISNLYAQAGYSSKETWLPSYFRIDLLTAISDFLKTKQSDNENIRKMMKQYQKKAKDYQKAPFYQKLSVPEKYKESIGVFFKKAGTGINAPNLSPEQKITVLTPFIEIINQDDALKNTDYPNYLAGLLNDAQKKFEVNQQELAQEKAAAEEARLKREAKQEVERLKKEEEARRKAQKQEAAEKARLEEKRRQAEVLKRVLAPTPGAGDLVSERQKKQNLQAAIRGQKQEEHRAQVEERNRREMDDCLENLRKQYRDLSPSGREKLKDTFKDNQDVQTFFGRLDAQLALEAEEQRLVAEYERIEQLKQEIIEQERLALLEHYRTNLASFIFHCSKYIRENPKLTDQARQSLENLIASLQRKIETSGQLTKAHFLAMEQNSLLAEAVSVMEELPEIKDHFDTANSMWNSILEGYKNPH